MIISIVAIKTAISSFIKEDAVKSKRIKLGNTEEASGVPIVTATSLLNFKILFSDMLAPDFLYYLI